MDSRTRRYMKETKTDSYNISHNPEFKNMEIMPNVTLTLPLYYPFRPPILNVHGKSYIEYFSLLFSKYKAYIELHDLNIECICCKSVICDWTPCWGIKELIQEFKIYSKKMALISKSKWVLDKLVFDNLVCYKIVHYLI